MSAGGLRIRSVALLQPDAEIEGTLVLSDSTILLKGVVAWMIPPDHAGFIPAEIGIELSDVPEAYLSALAGLFADQD
jgi:hypothetical protein